MTKYNFKNCILIIVFNYSNCVCNKNVLNNIYINHFKKIIYYSDYPSVNDEDVNFVNIYKGYNVHNIFNHFKIKYNEELKDIDGIFYTMDDNIINVNILNLFNNDKIIYNYNEIKELSNYTGWWWTKIYNGNFGKIAINNLLNDAEFKKYNINKFSNNFSDFFYLPKKYLDDKLFDLFKLFSKHNVFLEISIPTIINNIEQNKLNYQTFTSEILWNKERNNFLKKEYIYNSLNHKHNLILHPIKFNANTDSKKWLSEFFCKNKCIIITTINEPTDTIKKHINNDLYDVIIVGDKKTPETFNNLNCIYLNTDVQEKLFPMLSKQIPYNHYCRKNIGYLYAIKKGYDIIYETDDDNVPDDNFDRFLQNKTNKMITTNDVWLNIFKYFTNNAYIWPRGYPLSLIKINNKFSVVETLEKPSIINGLVENDPDVDALFRLICNHQETITWEKDKSVLIDNKKMCVFNSQNTFWLNTKLFVCLLIPSTVSFRYCDILRGIINNIIIKKTNNYIMYTSPNVIQYRNEHNLISDFKSEYEMYIHNENILNYIEQNIENETNIIELMKIIYNNLLIKNIITHNDIDILNTWLSYF